MTILIDTNIAIHLRDRNLAVIGGLAARGATPTLSIISRIELDAAVAARPADAERLRAGNRELYRRLSILPFDIPEAEVYAAIIARTGFSRRLVLDRLIAATAIVHGLTLVTINGGDFRDIPGLDLEVWPAQ
ncbi:hypothetical protein ASG29_04795 [Sphingomonas sp. Leaf412]|uniref:PIN domain-containing protein n=1 Tax=Sphingomonas sp. Leaf412 TaxID=1736370 RepID=UPI0006F3C112|nr:PIN domain-containing protein [Sphingomonas sp. Leaf412]KQT33379.1 hypothetical protein ASG29_04795 [Sphingomonas sp. Leaf412]